MNRLLLCALLSLSCARSQPPAHAHGHHEGPHHAGDGGPLVHRFDKADDWAKTFDDPARDAWQKPAHVMALMQIESGMRVADLGTGTGYFLPYLSLAAGNKGSVLALDVEPDMIRYVRERAAREKLGNVEARVVKLDDPGLEPSSVDRVLVVDTWHHIPERRAYAAKLASALRPNGMIFVVDFTMEAEHGPPKHHRIAPAAVVEELASAGLDAKVVAEELPDQYVVVGRR